MAVYEDGSLASSHLTWIVLYSLWGRFGNVYQILTAADGFPRRFVWKGVFLEQRFIIGMMPCSQDGTGQDWDGWPSRMMVARRRLSQMTCGPPVMVNM